MNADAGNDDFEYVELCRASEMSVKEQNRKKTFAFRAGTG